MENHEFWIMIFLFVSALIAGTILYNPKKNLFVYILRSLGLFLLFLFIWDPGFYQKRFEEIKPELIILSDISPSIQAYLETSDQLAKNIMQDETLNKKFQIKRYYFADSLYNQKVTETKHTNITRAINEIVRQQKSQYNKAIVLITDGYQTLGPDYVTSADRFPFLKIYPLALGDTNRYVNIKIERIDYNQMVSKGNYYFIKTIVSAENLTDNLNTKWTLYKDGKKIQEKNIHLTPERNFQEIVFKSQAQNPGIHVYDIRLKPVENEKNTQDNRQKIRIQVIEKNANILLLTGKIHPDVGIFKRILSRNKAFQITVSNNIPEDKTFDLIIYFQPQKKHLDLLEKLSVPLWFITGIHTDWNAINNSNLPFNRKTSGQLTEEYFPYSNPAFDLFDLPQIENNFPPLKDFFGKIITKEPPEIIYYSRIRNTKTHDPLALIFPDKKTAVLFGQGIWKWNIFEKRNGKELQTQTFISKTVEYLINKATKEQLKLNYKNEYSYGESIKIYIEAYNLLMEPNPKATINFILKNSSGKKQEIPVFYQSPYFVASLNDLEPGEYTFQVKYPDFNLSKTGFFEVKTVPIEKDQGVDIQSLQRLAEQTGGKFFTADQIRKLKEELINDASFKTVIKEHKRKLQLTDRILWLFLFVLLISTEWFYRKYKGMI